MPTSFLFDGSEVSKDMIRIHFLYCDDGFKVLPPSYLSTYISSGSKNGIGNFKDLAQYEKELDSAISFVNKNTVNQLSTSDWELFNRFLNEYIDYFKNSPKHADPSLETGEDGLTYINLIAPELLDAFKDETDTLKMSTFKYMLSVNNAYAIASTLNPQDDIVVTNNSKKIIESFKHHSPTYKISDTIQNATSILLPNYKNLSLVDTMEIKLKAKDELDEMNHYLSTVLSDNSGDMAAIEQQIRNKVEPAIKNIEHKIRGIKYGLAQKLLAELKTPASYLPLIISFVADAKPEVSLTASLLLIASGAAIDYAKQRHEIKAESLYCVHRLRKLADKK